LPLSFAENYQRFINIPNFDAAQSREQRSQQRHFIVGEGDRGISKDTYQLLKALAGLKGVSLNAVVSEAIDYWLESDSIREMIRRHNLED
jgi:hypothetical protein